MKKTVNQSTLTLILNGISISALLIVLILLFIYSSVSGQLNEATESRFELTYNANRFMNASSYLTNEVRAFAATGNKIHYDNYWNEVNNLKNRDLGVSAMQSIGITQEEQRMIDDMYLISNNLVPLEEKAMENVQNGLMKEAVDYVYGDEYNASISEINSLKEQFIQDLNMRTLEEVETLIQSSNYIKIAIIFAVFMVGIIQLINMTVIKKRVLNPIIKVRDQMGEISRGNLSAEFLLEPDTSEIGMLVASIHETKNELKEYVNDIDSKLAQMANGNMNLTINDDYIGEFLPIQNAMRQIVDALNKALSQINLTAVYVSEESESLALGAQNLSNATQDQSCAVKELFSNIKKISEDVEQTSKDADDAKKCAEEAEEQLKMCEDKMESLTEAIEDISRSSQEIGGIIKTIEDISLQTNILAINAAVESARAGEAGKGFAVVADEVQSLAYKSSESAKNISRLIKNSMELVQYGTSISADTKETLSTVILSSEKSAEMVERITGSAIHQSNSLKKINEGMEQISNAVQTNMSTAKESAESARKLNIQAEKLKISVHRFKLRER